MIYRNSTKVLMNNFNLVWKQLLYILFSLCIVFGLTYLCALPVLDMLKKANWFVDVRELLESVYISPKDFLQAFNGVTSNFLVLIKNNFENLWVNYLLIIFVVLFVSMMLIHMSVYVNSEIIDSKMSSITKLGFISTLFSRFWKSMKYAFVKIICDIPFLFLEVVSVFLYVFLAKNWLSSIVLFPILVMLLVFIISLKNTLFSCFTAEIIYNKKRSTWKCLARAVNRLKTSFGAILSNYIILSLTIVLINVVVGLFTLGAGLLVSIPASIIWTVSMGLTIYYINEKKRFYVSENTIVDPNY